MRPFGQQRSDEVAIRVVLRVTVVVVGGHHVVHDPRHDSDSRGHASSTGAASPEMLWRPAGERDNRKTGSEDWTVGGHAPLYMALGRYEQCSAVPQRATDPPCVCARHAGSPPARACSNGTRQFDWNAGSSQEPGALATWRGVASIFMPGKCSSPEDRLIVSLCARRAPRATGLGSARNRRDFSTAAGCRSLALDTIVKLNWSELRPAGPWLGGCICNCCTTALDWRIVPEMHCSRAKL